MSTAKMVFHGSDIEKICEVYQLKSEEIVKFGANVNPLGLSEHVKEQLAGRLDILSSYPDRDYTSLRTDRTADTGTKSKAYPYPGSDLFRILQGTLLLRKHSGILPPARRG